MAETLRTVVEQDMRLHTLGHIETKLKGNRKERTTFVIVEGGDDLAFYGRFFDRRCVAMYYATKLTEEGIVTTGGCAELQNIVKTVLEGGKTDKVLGIMDTDYRKYIKDYEYPRNIFHTDSRDMETTALNTPSVNRALSQWIPDYEGKMRTIEPVLRHAGERRILNDKFRIGCNFGKCKISKVFDDRNHTVFGDWKQRYNKAFLHASLNNKRKNTMQQIETVWNLCRAFVHQSFHSYKQECTFDVLQGHDTLLLLSLMTANNSVYSIQAIWEKCFDAYKPSDFAQTRLFAAIDAWQPERGLSLFKAAVA